MEARSLKQPRGLLLRDASPCFLRQDLGSGAH